MKYFTINYDIKFHGAVLYQIMENPSITSLLRNFTINGCDFLDFYIFFNLIYYYFI